MKSIYLTVSMFSVLPVPPNRVPDADRSSSAVALRWLPLLGALLGALSTGIAMLFWSGAGHGSTLLAAVTVVAALALLTRGLHLDGLADVADGLGSRRPPGDALAIMRQSDIGPFGVAVLVLVLMAQVAAISELFSLSTLPQTVVVMAAVTAVARFGALDAAAVGIAAARPGGFGALVSGTASPAIRWGIGVIVLLAIGGLTTLVGLGPAGVAWLLGALLLSQIVTVAFRRHCVRRLGGMTGDVFGALIEVGMTSALLLIAAVLSWRSL